MLVFLKRLLAALTKVFVRKVTFLDAEGEEVTSSKAREGWKGLGWIVGFLIVWHFILQPILAHHFPDYSFPALDGGWISGLLLGL